MKRYVVLAVLAPWLAVVSTARAEVRVSVVATDPSTESAALGANEPFYLRLEYAADEPIRIWARPFFRGQEVARAKTNASASYSGAGHALGWFSLDGPSQVDEVRIRVGGGTPYREWEAARHPVQILGTGLPAAARAKAAWVDELLREQESARRRDLEQRMNQPVSVGEIVVRPRACDTNAEQIDAVSIRPVDTPRSMPPDCTSQDRSVIPASSASSGADTSVMASPTASSRKPM